jgi:hypothetical protein
MSFRDLFEDELYLHLLSVHLPEVWMWVFMIYVCCWQTSPSLRAVPSSYVSDYGPLPKIFNKTYKLLCRNPFHASFIRDVSFARHLKNLCFRYVYLLGWRSTDGWTHSCVLLMTHWREREEKSLSSDYNNISLCIEVALNIIVSLALVLYVWIIAHNMQRHRLLLQPYVLRRRRFYNRWQLETSPEVCFIVGSIIRALAGGGTGLIVVILRSSIMQSNVPCCAAPSNGALGPHNVLILAQLSLRLINWALRSKGGGGGGCGRRACVFFFF